ncbi:uncharacterized protein LOC101900644 isoform X2 [Musca domestica]|uniref:Regulatory protein zeste n=1 Tax=Musca domestica TaxID=7370 RepID=A0A1I8M5E0_MUSDO|nr:uncharacterized protein LOC101900644 isoform X2 [Musca domestica]
MDRVTKPQKKMLITLLRETKFMEGKKEKEWYWEKIQEALNRIGPKKTIIQWKKCWRDMRLTTRKKLAELKRCQMAGGSPPPGIELSQEDNDIIDIVGTEYFYEEMNGELKPENFITGFDYVPEHFCDAILTAAAVSSGQQHMQHQKEQQQQQHAQQQQQQDHHTNDGETNDAPGSSNHADTQAGPFGQANVSQMTGQNGDHSNSTGTLQQHNILPNHPAFSGGLHPHLMRRQHQATAAFHREAAFEEKLLQFMQDAFPKKSKKRKSRDPDKLFLLSLYEEIKRVPEDIRLDVKSELIQVLKRYQKKSPIKQEKTNHTHAQSSSSSGKSSGSTTPNEKIQLPQQQQQHTQLSHSMYQLQKKYDKSEKEPSPQSQVDRVQQHSREQVAAAAAAAAAVATGSVASLHAPQQIPHTLFQLQKKYEESAAEKVHQQNDQRKHVEAAHQQHQSAHQQPPPPPPSNEQQQQQHLHHPQMTHGIMFPLPQIRSEQPGGGGGGAGGQQHHAHNPHAQQPQQSQHHQQQTQHHPPSIFGNPATTAGGMTSDRPAMSYENVG